MQSQIIFFPVLAHMLLTILLLFWLARAKDKSKREGTVDLDRRALHPDAWPETVMKIANNIKNQFELPVLFYILSMILWATDSVDEITLSFAIAFVVSRYVHAYIHTGTNIVKHRLLIFLIGSVFLIVLFVAALCGTVRAFFY